jgi:hypothetical protein
MAMYEVTLDDRRLEEVEADTYLQEGPMTTFFRTRGAGAVVDSWATRLASYRTADLLAVRRVEEAALLERPRPLAELRSA